MVRLTLLAAAVLLAMGGPLPYLLVRVFPGLSPLVAVACGLARRQWYWELFWGIPPALVMMLGFWKGRFFCRWICPAGTLYAIPSRWSRGRKLLKFRLNGYIFWIIMLASLVGEPLVLLFDPLSTFNRLTPVLTGTYTIASLVPGLLVPLMLLLCVFQPMIWCTHLCPLGYLFELSHSLSKAGARKTFDRTRRQITAGICIGVPAAILARKFLPARRPGSPAPVLPPGAGDLQSFAATCTLCYACVNVCPGKVISAGSLFEQTPGELFQPRVKYFQSDDRPDEGFCVESCNQCSQVCPSGALMPLTLRQKRQRKMGTAEIIRSACLAWTDGEYCMVCQEHCPYFAIELDLGETGVPRPVVNADICRGCGLCEHVCPAIRAGKAIIVRGVREQSHIDDDYAELMDEA